MNSSIRRRYYFQPLGKRFPVGGEPDSVFFSQAPTPPHWPCGKRLPDAPAKARHLMSPMAETQPNIQRPPTIYDVARAAGVSIASVSRVLNGHRNPRQGTRDRVLRAVAELGYVPDGAARALSVRLKEVVGVVFRRGAQPACRGGFCHRGGDPPRPPLLHTGPRGAAPRARLPPPAHTPGPPG